MSCELRKAIARWSKGTRLALTASLMITCAGCKTVKVISADRALRRMETNEVYRFPVPGWFVPDALMIEITRELEAKRFQLEKNSR